MKMLALGICTNIVTKLRAIQEGPLLVVKLGFHHIILETDYLLIVN